LQSSRSRAGGACVVGIACVVAAMASTAQAAGELATGSRSGLPLPRFVSIKPDRVNVRGGPTRDHEVTWVYTRAGLPVEITAESENWRRIRDWEGAEGWVYHSMLSGRRTALVKAKEKDGLVPLRVKPAADAEVTANLQSGVLGTVKHCTGTWCRIFGHGFDGWVAQERLWGVYPDERVEERSPPKTLRLGQARASIARMTIRYGWTWSAALAPQANHHVDAGDLIAFGRDRRLADDHVGIGNVEKCVLALDEEMVMLGIVGIEIGLGAVDCDLAQESNVGELVQRVVDRSQRHRHLGLVGFLVEHLRRDVTIALAKQDPAERHALAGRTQTDLPQ